jgi:3-deoxy-manno-octulosonate cytidylyltransferase (CMP-KDO synthetase)
LRKAHPQSVCGVASLDREDFGITIRTVIEMPKIPSDYLIVIPARFDSSRLPGKPLREISGKPMIIRTAERCLRVANPDQVIVATDDLRIAEVCQEFGIRFEITEKSHSTGSDRVAEVASRIPASVYINVQGDEPVFNPDDILILAEESAADLSKAYIGYCDMSEEEWRDTKNIKLLFGLNNQLIYIGRAQVPGSHSGDFRVGYRQVCAYAYTQEILRDFSKVGQRTPLENLEDNEVMRFLELGIKVQVVKMSNHSISVDRPSDIPRVERRLGELAEK